MKTCPNCGKVVEDNILICPKCGSYVDSTVSTEAHELTESELQNLKKGESQAPRVLSILSLIFGILGGYAAIVLGIIGLILDKQKKYTTRYIAGIVLAVCWIAITIVLYVLGYIK